MEFTIKDFFTEKEANDVGGFVVIDTDEGGAGYRMAEKWNRPERDGGPTWLTYWISEEALQDRLDAGKCAHAKTISAKQFRGVLNLAGVSDQYQEAMAATA